MSEDNSRNKGPKPKMVKLRKASMDRRGRHHKQKAELPWQPTNIYTAMRIFPFKKCINMQAFIKKDHAQDLFHTIQTVGIRTIKM
jgi:hypothetical protein